MLACVPVNVGCVTVWFAGCVTVCVNVALGAPVVPDAATPEDVLAVINLGVDALLPAVNVCV
jgi:hypothetical protein